MLKARKFHTLFILCSFFKFSQKLNFYVDEQSLKAMDLLPLQKVMEPKRNAEELTPW